MIDDIRWKQRFENFKNSLINLELAKKIEEPDIIQKAGLIQLFEISFELGWKVLKDYLESQGFNDVKSPRAAIKKAFELGLIDNGEAWLEALQDRNLSTHTYDEGISNQIVDEIKKRYFNILIELKYKLAKYE